MRYLAALACLLLPAGAWGHDYLNCPSEPGFNVSANTLFCDDFDDGDMWYTVGPAGCSSAQNDGWCGYGSYGSDDCPGSTGGRAACAGSGAVGTNCSSCQHATSKFALRSFKGVQGAGNPSEIIGPGQSIFVRYYWRWSGSIWHEKMNGFSGLNSSDNTDFKFLESQGQEYAFKRTEAHPQIGTACSGITGSGNLDCNVASCSIAQANRWYFIEIQIKLDTNGNNDGEYRMWLDDCGTSGTSCPATPTLRSQYTGLDWRCNQLYDTIATYSIEGFSSGPPYGPEGISSGFRRTDQIVASRTGPIGFMTSGPTWTASTPLSIATSASCVQGSCSELRSLSAAFSGTATGGTTTTYDCNIAGGYSGTAVSGGGCTTGTSPQTCTTSAVCDYSALSPGTYTAEMRQTKTTDAITATTQATFTVDPMITGLTFSPVSTCSVGSGSCANISLNATGNGTASGTTWEYDCDISDGLGVYTGIAAPSCDNLASCSLAAVCNYQSLPAGNRTAEMHATRSGITASRQALFVITASPTWTTTSFAPSPTSCTEGAAACATVGFNSAASGSASGTSSWQYDCDITGGFSGTTAGTCASASSPQNCNLTSVCNFQSHAAGTYTMEIRSTKGGITSALQASFTVNSSGGSSWTLNTLVANPTGCFAGTASCAAVDLEGAGTGGATGTVTCAYDCDITGGFSAVAPNAGNVTCAATFDLASVCNYQALAPGNYTFELRQTRGGTTSTRQGTFVVTATTTPNASGGAFSWLWPPLGMPREQELAEVHAWAP